MKLATISLAILVIACPPLTPESRPLASGVAEVAGSVDPPPSGGAASIFVESDNSKGWQEFLAITSTSAAGDFRLNLTRPGFYWILAIESAGRNSRRGACLVEVDEKQHVAWHRLPKLQVSNRWGGKGSSACEQRKIRLFSSKERATLRYAARK